MDQSSPITSALHRVFNVERGEGALALLLGLLLFGNSMSIQMSSIIAISGFLSSDSINSFLLVLFFDMVLVLVATSFQTVIVDRFDRADLLRCISLIFAVAFVLLWVLIQLDGTSTIYYSLLYILSEQQLLFFPLLVWALAGDLFSPAQSKRVFPMINSLRFIGRISGLAVVVLLALLPLSLQANAQLGLAIEALFYVAAFALVTLRLKRKQVTRTPAQSPLKETLLEGWNFIKDVPMFRYLTLAVLLISTSDILIEFRFLTVSETAFSGTLQYETFFSLYRIVIALVCFALSGLVVSRLLHAINLKNAFYILPAFIAFGAVLMLLSSNIVPAVAAMGLMQIARDSVYDSSRMAVYALVPNERRGRVSIFTDSYVLAVGTLIGVIFAGAVVFLDSHGPLPDYVLYLSFVVVMMALALFAARRLTQVYDKSLLNWRLRRRTRANSVLSGLDL
jgi:ATP/ADP translocase